jgi:biopolymer transport protein ExbD
MKFDREPYDPMSIDMTPLVDCIFAIILFLLVTSSFVESMELDMSIELPTISAVARPPQTPGRPVVVNVRFRGGQAEYHIESQIQTLDSLKVFLADKRVKFKDQAVVIRGDRNVKWDHVAAVMRTCAQAGVSKVYATYEMLDTR